MDAEITIAIVSGLFALLSALVASVNAIKTKRAQRDAAAQRQKTQLAHEKELKQLRLAYEKEMESERIANTEKVDMSSIVVQAQENISNAFQAQFAQAQTQYKNLQEEFKAFKEESKKDREHYKKVTETYQTQVKHFKRILSAIKFNLLLMGARIDEIYGFLEEEESELVFKVRQLSSIYKAVLSSLESVDTEKVVSEKMLIHFDMKPLDDDF